MARAIFKSCFVDFDPVRAKMEGREPAGMDAETAALFPDAFEASELGEIPRGWSAGGLADIAREIRRGIDPNSIPPDTPYIGLEHMPRRSIALPEWGRADQVESNKFAFQRGDVLFGKLRPYFHKVGVAVVDGVCSTDIVVLNATHPAWYSFVLATVSSEHFVNYTAARANGTRMPRTKWADMAEYRVVLPPAPIAGAFNSLIVPFIERIQVNIAESRTLARIRDRLLPKLISGQIRVEDAGKLVEAAV